MILLPRGTTLTAKIDLTTLSRDGLRKHFATVARRAAKRVLAQYPNTLAIAVDGSVGRDRPLPYSDVDIFVIMPPGRRPTPISYFDSGCLVGVGFNTFNKKGKVGLPTSAKGIDFFWARGGSLTSKILYDRKGILKRHLKFRRSSGPPGSTVEDILCDSYYNIIEYAGKLRNGWHVRDEYLTRYAARIIAERSQNALMALNQISPPSENIVWHLVMKAKKKPPHFRADYPIALGLKGTGKTREVFVAALRLAQESLRLIRKESGGTVTHRNFRTLLAQPLETLGL